MFLNCGVGEDTWESLGLQGDPTSPFWRRSALGFLWREWCWSWNSSTLATSCEELTHWKRPWCWEILKAGREGDDRGWDGWMASLTWWTWVWASCGSWWWTGKPGALQSKRLQRIRHNWVTELNWMLPKLQLGGQGKVVKIGTLYYFFNLLTIYACSAIYHLFPFITINFHCILAYMVVVVKLLSHVRLLWPHGP